jgi:arabinose-5-phosphate isomerase
MSATEATSAVRPQDVGRAAIQASLAGLDRLAAGLGDDFDRAADRLIALQGKVLLLGVGKSGHAAAKVAATFRSIGVPALSLNASELLHGDLGVAAPGDVAILFSKSGGTRELLELVPHLRARGLSLMAVVGTPRSELALACDLVLDASVEREGCPLDAAPMASVLVAQAMGDALAAAIAHGRNLRSEDFARLHPAGALGVRLTLTVADVMRRGDELPSVHAGATLRDTVIEITRTGYGAVCVVDGDGMLVGFATDGDVRRSLLTATDIGAVGVRDIMSSDPLSVAPGLLLSEALLMLEARTKPFLTAPVTDEHGRCVGLLRLHDTVRAHLPA